jgi:hypothetical protein
MEALMRQFSGMFLLVALLCSPAQAQRSGGGMAPAVAKPPASTPAIPATKLPEVPAGQWDDTILSGAKVQSFDGQAYAAIEFERLQEHVDSICHYDRAAGIIGKPVATIVGYRQNMGWPALVDGKQIDIVKATDEAKYMDRLMMPFLLVDVTKFLEDVRNDLYFKTCGGLNFKVCSVAIYGRFRYDEAKTIPDWGADLLIGDKKCIFELEHYRKMGIVDYGDAINKVTLDSFYKGMAVAATQGAH